jgi:hypothetical protein
LIFSPRVRHISTGNKKNRAPLISEDTVTTSSHLPGILTIGFANNVLFCQNSIIVTKFSGDRGKEDAKTASKVSLGRCRACGSLYHFCTTSGPSANLPNRLCDPLVPFGRVARIRALRKSPRGVHPPHHTLACGTAATNLAVPDGRSLHGRH